MSIDNRSNIFRFMGISYLDNNDLLSLSLIYNHLLSINAFNFYLLSVGFSKNYFQIDSVEIAELLNITVDELGSLRIELEKVNLINTLSCQINYVINVNKPLSISQFFKHPILSRYFIYNIHKPFDMKKYVNADIDLSDFIDISAKLEVADLDNYHEDDEIRLKDHQVSTKLQFNWNIVSNAIMPQHLKTDILMLEIEKIIMNFNVSNQQILLCIGDSVSFDRNSFDLKIFEKKIRDMSYKNNINSTFNEDVVNSYQFLLNKQNGIPLSNSDIKLIDRLKSQYKLNDEVINIVLEYCLDKYDNKLANNVVEKIVTSLIRANCLTKDLALDYLHKNDKSKPKNKVVKKRLIKPEYKINNDEVIEENKIDEMYKKMKGW